MSEMAEKAGLATYRAVRTRVAGLPDSFGYLPCSALPDDILTEGDGRIRAVVMVGANPVLAGPAGPELEAALGTLELFVSLDAYQNETNQHANYILPTTLMYERADAPLQFIDRMSRPMLQVTEALVRPPGECREEWRILNAIARRMGLGGAYSSALLRLLARFGLAMSPKALADVMIRTSLAGDRFGLRRRGLSWRKLAREHRHGVVLQEILPVGELGEKLKHADGRIALADPRVLEEITRLEADGGRLDPEYPFRLIGLREIQSHNSWMHNVERLMPRGRQQTARINPADASALGIATGRRVVVRSRSGEITVPVTVSGEVGPGCIAIPHGWGHSGGWRRANEAGGVNANVLASRRPEDLEQLAGMTVLNGLPVRVEPVPQ
jgi:formate dehydrogenase